MTRGAGAALVALSALAGCGGAGTGEELCEAEISFSPSQPEAGRSVVATAVVSGAEGFLTFDWSVARGGAPIGYEANDEDGQSIRFAPAEAGVYEVSVEVTDGGASCLGDLESLNVREPGAEEASYWLRAVPPPGIAPPQALVVQIPRGSDYDLGRRALSPGIAVSGRVIAPGGSPIAADLRIERAGRPLLEDSAAAEGYELLVPNETFDVLVMPRDGNVAPARLRDLEPGDLDGDLALAPGVGVSGAVLEEGAPLEGARIALALDGVPSTLATTDGAGALGARARPGSSLSLTVVPPAGSGLPRLEGRELSAPIGEGSELEVRYAGEGAARSVSFAVFANDGESPLEDARVTFLARPIPNAGSAAVDGAVPMDLEGTVRESARTDASGVVGPLPLPEAIYDVVVDPPPGAGEAVLVTSIDLSAGSSDPRDVIAPEPAMLRGRLLEGGAPVAGARVLAAPQGSLAVSTAAAASVRSDESGEFTLPLAPGGEYVLTFVAGARRHVLPASAPAAGESAELGDVVLPESVELTGSLGVGGGDAAGVHLTLLCAACDPSGAATPIAEAVTDAGGGFRFRVPKEGSGP